MVCGGGLGVDVSGDMWCVEGGLGVGVSGDMWCVEGDWVWM